MTEAYENEDNDVEEIEATDRTPEAVNLSQTQVECIEAELVRASQSGIGKVNATEVEIRQGGAIGVDAEKVSIVQGGILMTQSDQLDISQGGLGVANVGDVTFNNSQVGAVFSDTANLNEATANLLVTRRVYGGPVRSTILLAGQVDGPVETMLDTPRALLVGIAAGMSMGLLLFLGNILTGKNR
jgi:hypothetical protein